MISIALFEPQIPPNTGNIARLAVGLDIELIIVGKPAFSLDDKQVKRAGLDYWQDLKLTTYPTLEQFLEATKDRRKILATTKGTSPYFKFNYSKNDIIFLGSETGGLPLDYIKANLDNSVTIPMPGKVRSLNLSNSAAILVYHALERTGYFKDFDLNSNFYEEL